MPVSLPAFLTRPQITAQVRTADLPPNFIFNRWFPDDEVDADEFEGLVVVDQMELAPFVHVDAETPSMPDDIFGAYQWAVAYIRFKKRFKESDLRIFHEPGIGDPNTLASGNARAAETKIRRYIDALSQSVDARKEWIIANALNGSVAYDDSNVQYTVNFAGAFIGSNRQVPALVWSNSSSTPITDLSNWVETVSDESNNDRWILVTSRNVLGYMARSSEVRTAYAANTQNPAFAALPSLNPTSLPGAPGNQSMSATMLGPALTPLGIEGIISYNTRYSTRSGGAFAQTRTRVRFTDNRDLWLLPVEPLGRMASAPAAANDFRSGKFGWEKRSEDPWVVEVGAGEYSWIDWPGVNWNKVLQARVL